MNLEDVKDKIRNSVRDSVWNPVGYSVMVSVRDSVRFSTRNPVWHSVQDSVGKSVDGLQNPIREERAQG
jgi:hypothetical protein